MATLVRRVGIVAGSAGLLMAIATPSWALLTVTAVSPGSDDVLEGPVDAAVRVARDALEQPPASVSVGLAPGGIVGPLTPLRCVEDDGCEGLAPPEGDDWADGVIDPRELACNGSTQLVAIVDEDRVFELGEVMVSVPPAPPQDVAAALGQTGEVTLTWVATPADDVRFRVERRAQGTDEWVEVVTLGPGTSRFEDAPGLGTWEHRVVALRGDGVGPDGPLAPCADAEDDLVAASAATSTTVGSQEGGTGSGSGAGAGAGEGGEGGGTNGGAGEEGSGNGGTSGGSGRDVTAPPPPTRSTDASTGVSVDVPSGSGGSGAVEEDTGFESVLDYTDVITESDGDGAGSGPFTRLAAVFGGWDSLRFVGLGVVFIGAGLRLRRWRREQDELP